MPSRTLVTISLAVLLAVLSNSAPAWQVDEPLPTEPSPITSEPLGAEPLPAPEPLTQQHSFFGAPQYDSTWLGADYNDAMYDTSLIPRRNRATAFEGAAGVPPGRPWWKPSAITGQFIWLDRTGADFSQLLTGGVLNPVTLAVDHSTAVTMSDLELPVAGGFRGSVLLGRPGNWQPELAYLGIFNQKSSVRYDPEATAAVIETAATFFDLVLINPVTDITVSYESDLHSTECNFWFDDDWRFQGLVGARWIQQTEQFGQMESQTVANRTFADITNNLIGGQLGFRTYLFERGKLSMFAIGKGGMFYNEVHLFADAQSGGAVLGSMEQTGHTTACVGEINLTAMWQLSPYCNFHFGYTGLWLSQVGLVGDQLNDFTFASGGGTFDYGGISYQGGHLGMTLSW